MNHEHVTNSSLSIGQMEIMWVLMVVMFGWNLWMVYQHKKLQKKVECHCGAHPCVKCESSTH